MSDKPHYSEGICEDGAAILRDGVPMRISEVLAALNSLPAPQEAGADGLLWQFMRSVLAQGTDIYKDYVAGSHKTYEAYSARLDAAAHERVEELARRTPPRVPEGFLLVKDEPVAWRHRSQKTQHLIGRWLYTDKPTDRSQPLYAKDPTP